MPGGMAGVWECVIEREWSCVEELREYTEGLQELVVEMWTTVESKSAAGFFKDTPYRPYRMLPTQCACSPSLSLSLGERQLFISFG